MKVDLENPWILLILTLVGIHAFFSFMSAFGYISDFSGNVLTSSMEMGWLIMVAVDIIILYALYEGQAWAWWLLLFDSIVSILSYLLSMALGYVTAMQIIYFMGYVLLLLALTKREVLSEYKPNTTYLKGW